MRTEHSLPLVVAQSGVPTTLGANRVYNLCSSLLALIGFGRFTG